MNQDGVERPNY